MKVSTISLHQQEQCDRDLCACIGYFDGLHRGHQALLDKTIELAEQYGCESALITFSPDPWITTGKAQKVRHLTTMTQRIALAEKRGIERVIILDFTAEMAALPPEEFTEMLLRRCRLKALVCGFDFHYGARGKGNADSLRQEAAGRFEVAVIEAVSDEQGKISSSRISRCIEEGAVEDARRLLGYPYEIEGTVIHGRHKGSQWGFPTANLDYSDEMILPLRGVYIGRAESGPQRWMAMINNGHNTTCNPVRQLAVEAHLLDGSQDLYGCTLRLFFYRRIRPEQRFDSLEELLEQLQRDRQAVRDYFQEHDDE